MRCLPCGSTVTTSASRNTRRCREMAGWLTVNWSTSSLTVQSRSASASTICRRVSSASAVITVTAAPASQVTYNRLVMHVHARLPITSNSDTSADREVVGLARADDFGVGGHDRWRGQHVIDLEEGL